MQKTQDTAFPQQAMSGTERKNAFDPNHAGADLWALSISFNRLF